jgi:predicted dienelactone hydrolase
MKIKYKIFFLFLVYQFVKPDFTVRAQIASFVNGDALPDAPVLSKSGEFKVGVKTIDWINKNQLDILNSKKDAEVFYDRKLKAEIWYPSDITSSNFELESYNEVMGSSNDPKRPLIEFSFLGRAIRNAPIAKSNPNFPLIIVSHGYLGSRYLMTYLTENLASKGYIVVAIDHTESTFRDAAGFTSTLLNRSKDVLFVLKKMEEMGQSDLFFKTKIDIENIGLIGYSMGGYGVLNVAGAGYSENSLKLFSAISGGSDAIKTRVINNPEYQKSLDKRIKAVVAFAPWGMERGLWDSTSLMGLKTPTFFVAGDQDDISGYEKGIKAIFKGSLNAERYLLTYLNARHNIAPNPPPTESLREGLHFDEYYRYAEPSWNERRINNINQHFLTAFLGKYLKNQDFEKYLNLTENSNLKTWEGFKARSSTGMKMEYEKPK